MADREGESQPFWDAETQESKVSPELLARLRSTSSPDVLELLVSFKLMEQSHATHALANTMPDAARNVIDMQEIEEAEAKATDAAARCKGGHGSSARVSPYGAAA